MSPYFIVICVMVAAILVTITATRKNMNRRAAKEVLAALVLSLFALVFFGLSLLITDDSIRFILHELKFLPLAFLGPCTLLVYSEFTEQTGWLTRRNKLLLCVIPLLSVIFALTNNYHHIFRLELKSVVHNGVSYIETVPSWGYWIYSAYSYALYVAGLCILALDYYRKPRIYRGQIGFMIFTALSAVLVSVASTTGIVKDYGDAAILAAGMVTIVQYITIVNYSHRRVLMKAWNVIVGDLDSLIMIFDHTDRLVDSNRDASKLNGMIKTGADYLANPESVDGSVIFLPKVKEYYSVNEKRLYDKKERYTGRVLVIKDVSGLEGAANELRHIATHDYLTGLKNRRALHRELRSLKESDFPVALVIANILGMKLINNVFGNEYGDRAIISVAEELTELTPVNSSCMRIGGDEFGAILRNTNRTEAEEFIRKLKERLLIKKDTIEINLEASYALMHNNEQNAEQLFADISETLRKSGGTYRRSVSEGFMESLKESLSLLQDKTGRRSQRITELCMLTADRLSLSDSEKKELRLLADMADIGLLGISPAILKSKGDLSNEQWNEWKLHTIKGQGIALSILELSGIAKEILSHHERYDGYGYPQRLKGDDIPLLSRVYAAVEFYVDSPAELAKELLKQREGTQFDPNVARAVLAACE